MKKYISKIAFLSLFAAAVLFAFQACTHDNPEPEPEPKPDPEKPVEVTPGPGEYTFVLPEASVKTAWLPGDQIMVQGNYSPGAVTVTLKAEDITDNGRTAKVNLTQVPETFYKPDYLHAAYPAELLDMDANMFCDDIFNFKDTQHPLMCAWLADNNTFNFLDVCGAIKFGVAGDWDSCTLAGPAWEMVSYKSYYEVSVNSEKQVWRKAISEMDYFLKGNVTDGGATLYFPGGINLTKGFVIYFCKDGEYPKYYEYTQALNLAHDGVLDLGDITASLKDYDGPKPESPDMPKLTKHQKWSVKVPEMSGICLTADGSALWAVGDNGYFAQLSFDGVATKYWSKSADMEDITIHPETGDLYVALEDGSQAIARIKAPEYKLADYEVLFKVADAINYGNSGLEGIAYYKDNTIFVGSQVDANLFLYTLEGEQLSKVSLRKLTNNAILEVGGLCYDSKNNWLWLTDSETQKLYILDVPVTHILASYHVTYCGNNESVCVDPAHGCVWVGDDDDDNPELIKIEFEGL